MEAKKPTKAKTTTKKISDSNSAVSSGSRLEAYWQKKGFKTFFNSFRVPALDIENIVNVSNIESSILQKFNVKGIGFGNWVTNEDRYNYIGSLVIALYDLNKVLQFKFNLGLDKHLSITFGARGRGRALAHFEPWSNIINLTRYEKGTTEQDKRRSFLNSGGVGSLAHEYGHFLDYFFGSYIEPSTSGKALTAGHSTAVNNWSNFTRNSYRSLMQHIIFAIIYKKPGIKSDYYTGLEKSMKGDDYWFRHNELFARAFEQYIGYKLQRQNVNNRFLAKNKYNAIYYMKQGDLMRIIPLMDKLITKMSTDVKS